MKVVLIVYAYRIFHINTSVFDGFIIETRLFLIFLNNLTDFITSQMYERYNYLNPYQ